MKFDGSDIGVPVNLTAAKVTGKGVAFIPQKNFVIIHSENPLEVVKPEKNEKDLTGKKAGKLIVIGKSAKVSKGATWVVKCVCGRYTVRRSKTINNPDPEDCCEECRYLDYLKRREEFLKLGYNLKDRPKKEKK